MTAPFKVSDALSSLPHPYPSANALRKVLSNDISQDCKAIARLWLSEGVPFVFRSCPAIFEKARVWLSTTLEIDPKEITIIGSARIGYSLAKGKFGTRFNNASDLDFTIVSQRLFQKLVNDFECFKDDFRNGTITPRNSKESRYWPENVRVCSRTISKGFLDANKIPNLDRYAIAKRINNSMSILHRKLKASEEIPKTKKSSARVYFDWDKFVDQSVLSLKRVV